MADLIVAETTCDGKKKAYETFQDMVPNEFMALDMPNTKSHEGRAVLVRAYRDLVTARLAGLHEAALHLDGDHRGRAGELQTQSFPPFQFLRHGHARRTGVWSDGSGTCRSGCGDRLG